MKASKNIKLIDVTDVLLINAGAYFQSESACLLPQIHSHVAKVHRSLIEQPDLISVAEV